jgi:hypothetical protein
MHHVVSIQAYWDRHLVCWLHDAVDPSRAEWQQSYDKIETYRKATGIKVDQFAMLVVTDGAAPNAFERGYMAEHLPVPSAVVTTVLTNPIKRGIATAIMWTNPRFLFTEPKQWQRALDHLGESGHGEEIWNQFRELQKEMPENKTLQLIAKQCQLPSLAGVALKNPARSASG